MRALRGWLLVTIAFGATFLGGQALEYRKLLRHGVTIDQSLFASTFFTLTGFHGLHVVIGLVALGVLLRLAFARDFGERTLRALHAVGIYWHFVDVVWIAVFSVVYLRGVFDHP
jgi:heme/copper-type cytochrome/quinol oxidase subunit 3